MGKSIASPVSTGGGGSDFERMVGAYYLVLLLLQAVPRGQDAGVIREVRFQRLYEGEPLDDLVIVSEHPMGEAKLALQIKRDLTFGESDSIIDEVMLACWQTYKSPQFDVDVNRFGIVTALYSKTVAEYYQSVLTWARNSARASDFLNRIEQKGLSNATQKSFVQLVRSKLEHHTGGSISDDDLWNFLRSMLILHFDLQEEGSRDYSHSLDMLKVLLPLSVGNVSDVFVRLKEYAAAANRTAGSFDLNVLIQKLQADQISIVAGPNCREDLKCLNEYAKFVLGDIRTTIGGLTLNRSNLISQAYEQLQNTHVLEIVGLPGSGKSAILKALVEMQQGNGPVLVLSHDRLVGPGWNGFAGYLHLTQELSTILAAVSASNQPCVFIDGADRIVDAGSRKVINDILRTIAAMPSMPDGSPKWRIVLSSRDENIPMLHHWLEYKSFGQPSTLIIPELSEDELDVVAEHSPQLASLLKIEQLKPIAKQPFMLSLMDDWQGTSASETLSSVVTEIDMSVLWWQRWVGEDNANTLGTAKQQVLISLGKYVAETPGRKLPEEDIPADVLNSLVQSHVLSRDIDRDVCRFRHDRLEDWVLYRVLNRQVGNLPQYIEELGEPFGLYSAVQLLALFLLEKVSVTDWINVLLKLEKHSSLSLRWRQAFLTAPLYSTRAYDLLVKIEAVLLEQNAQRLNDLLVAVRTINVTPHPTGIPIPHWRVWLPLMQWMFERAEVLPQTTRPEAIQLMEAWQFHFPVGSIYRAEIGKISYQWLQEEEGRKYPWLTTTKTPI